jgi:hypothetical protein
MRKGRVRSAYACALASGKPSLYHDMRQSTRGHALMGWCRMTCVRARVCV